MNPQATTEAELLRPIVLAGRGLSGEELLTFLVLACSSWEACPVGFWASRPNRRRLQRCLAWGRIQLPLEEQIWCLWRSSSSRAPPPRSLKEGPVGKPWSPTQIHKWQAWWVRVVLKGFCRLEVFFMYMQRCFHHASSDCWAAGDTRKRTTELDSHKERFDGSSFSVHLLISWTRAKVVIHACYNDITTMVAIASQISWCVSDNICVESHALPEDEVCVCMGSIEDSKSTKLYVRLNSSLSTQNDLILVGWLNTIV